MKNEEEWSPPFINLDLKVGANPLIELQLMPPSVADSLAAGKDMREQEPSRCWRTDGKKWRCKNDVIPDQKYCERHIHRGRGRRVQGSRKLVEVEPSQIETAPISKTSLFDPEAPILMIPTPSIPRTSYASDFTTIVFQPESKTCPDIKTKANMSSGNNTTSASKRMCSGLGFSPRSFCSIPSTKLSIAVPSPTPILISDEESSSSDV